MNAQTQTVGTRRHRYNSGAGAEVSKEDMEAYRMRKRHADDPMANFVQEDDI